MKPLYTEIDFSYINRQVAKNGEVFKNVANRANVLHEERCQLKVENERLRKVLQDIADGPIIGKEEVPAWKQTWVHRFATEALK